MITYGTNPGMGIPIGGKVPAPTNATRREGAQVHGPRGGRAAARSQDRRRVHRQLHQLAHVAISAPPPPCSRGARSPTACAPWSFRARSGSRRQAEAEGLDRVFLEAGAEWREAGCSMCIAMNGDQLKPGQYAVSTSNRNFEGRQGAGAARSWPARRPPRPPRSRVASPTHGRWSKWNEARHLTSRTVNLPVENVDTDQIIPARFLKATSKSVSASTCSPTGGSTGRSGKA